MPTRITLSGPPPEQAPAIITTPNSSRRESYANSRRSSSGRSHLPTTPSFRRTIQGERIKFDEDLVNPDIRSSPRLARYLYIWICCIVMLVSVAQFYTSGNLQVINRKDSPTQASDDVVDVYGSKVYRYKLDGAFAISTGGVAIYLTIILVHFDTVFFPELWKSIFHNGSKGEKRLMLFLVLYWIAGLFLCTTVLSVGSVQANVYFTTWIAFVSNLLNFDVWRISAGKTAWADTLHSGNRGTTFNWFWTLVFSFITSLGASDTYINRDMLADKFEDADIHHGDQVIGLILTWVSVGIGIFALVGNRFGTRAYSVPCCQKCEFTLHWRPVEGCLIVTMLGMYGFVIFNYTGIQGVFNEPSNVYFGIWGTFFASIATFGTWLFSSISRN